MDTGAFQSICCPLARDEDPEAIDFQETDTNYAISWKGNYRIEGRAFVYLDRKSGRIITILGHLTILPPKLRAWAI
jgi:hypothetical protein